MLTQGVTQTLYCRVQLSTVREKTEACSNDIQVASTGSAARHALQCSKLVLAYELAIAVLCVPLVMMLTCAELEACNDALPAVLPPHLCCTFAVHVAVEANAQQPVAPIRLWLQR